jgi:hypothetical protein
MQNPLPNLPVYMACDKYRAGSPISPISLFFPVSILLIAIGIAYSGYESYLKADNKLIPILVYSVIVTLLQPFPKTISTSIVAVAELNPRLTHDLLLQ